MNTLYYIGCSQDEGIRFKSSSGGIGTAIVKYLLSLPEYGTAMTFVFDKQKCAYEPKLIYTFDDYIICGSIYQDTNNIQFLRDNIDKISGGIVVTCMPCQVKAIRNLLDSCHIKCFIISFCCSGQTTVEGTWFYYKLLGIKKEQVSTMQYRGNGWPSGIQITLNNNDVIYKPNWTYPWTIMHSSLLFRPKRCLFCSYKTVPDSDINLADPWLKEFEEFDKLGNSIIICNSRQSVECIDQMISKNEIVCTEIDEKTYYKSQKGTIESKKRVKYDVRYYSQIARLMSNKIYRFLATYNVRTLKLHIWLIKKLHKLYD